MREVRGLRASLFTATAISAVALPSSPMRVLVTTSRTRSVGWLISQAPPMAGAGASFQLSSGVTDDGCARMTSSMLRPSLACLVMLISAGLLPSALQGHGKAVHAHFVVARRPSQVEQHLPVGPCERHGERCRENVVLEVPFRQTREVAVVAAVGRRGRFGRRIGEYLARAAIRVRKSVCTPARKVRRGKKALWSKG